MSLFHMRTDDPDGLAVLLAQRSVERGIKWLNSTLPRNWWRNLFQPLPGGRWRFRAKDCYANECVLALAFENHSQMAAGDGYVHLASVGQRLGLGYGWQMRHGFETRRFRRRNITITSDILDAAWENLLLTSPLIERESMRHWTEIDQRFAEVDFAEDAPVLGMLSRWLRRLRGPVFG